MDKTRCAQLRHVQERWAAAYRFWLPVHSIWAALTEVPSDHPDRAALQIGHLFACHGTVLYADGQGQPTQSSLWVRVDRLNWKHHDTQESGCVFWVAARPEAKWDSC